MPRIASARIPAALAACALSVAACVDDPGSPYLEAMLREQGLFPPPTPEPAPSS